MWISKQSSHLVVLRGGIHRGMQYEGPRLPGDGMTRQSRELVNHANPSSAIEPPLLHCEIVDPWWLALASPDRKPPTSGNPQGKGGTVVANLNEDKNAQLVGPQFCSHYLANALLATSHLAMADRSSWSLRASNCRAWSQFSRRFIRDSIQENATEDS